MCLFSGAVHHVSGTRIYAGPRDEGSSIYQRIAYAMTVDVPESLAMVLPIPTPPMPAEDAVKFVDLSSCPRFFEELDALFIAPAGAPPTRHGPPPQNLTLTVHDVGDFEASFVPALRDFDRLDARFRLADDVWAQLPQYADWSFCVFKLRAEPAKKGFFDFLKPAPPTPPRKHHPMAFDFPRRNPNELFFPTVHVHDGVVHATAGFDHTLYAQPDEAISAEGWHAASLGTDKLREPARSFVRTERPLFKKRLEGAHPNRDITLQTSR